VGRLGRDSSPAPAPRGNRRRRPPGAGKAPSAWSDRGRECGAPDATRDGTEDATADMERKGRLCGTWTGTSIAPPRPTPPWSAVRPQRLCPPAQRQAPLPPERTRGAAAANGAEAETGGAGERQRWVARSAGWTGRSRAVGKAQGLAQRRTDPDTSPGGPRRGAGVVEGSAAEGGPRASVRNVRRGRRAKRAKVAAAAQQVSAGVATMARDLPAPGSIAPAPHGEECRGGEAPLRPGRLAGRYASKRPSWKPGRCSERITPPQPPCGASVD